MSRYKLALLLVFVLAAFLAAGFYFALEKHLSVSPPDVSQKQVRLDNKNIKDDAYRFIRAVETTAVSYISSSGIAVPDKQAVITSAKDGMVVEVLVNPGIRVGRDVPLARLDSSKAEANLAAQRPIVRLRHREYLEARTLYNHNKLDQDKYAEYLSAYEKALSEQEKLETELDSYSLRAPISGTILMQDIRAGERVIAGQELFRIGDPELLHLQVTLSQEEMVMTAIDQQVMIEIPAAPGNYLRGKVEGKYRIERDGSPSFIVHIDLPSDSDMTPGTEAIANIILNKEVASLLVPKSAVIENPEGKAVYVAQPVAEGGYRIYLTPVRVEHAGRNSLKVKEGLMDGDIIISNPSGKLADGMVVDGKMTEMPLDRVQEAISSNNWLDASAPVKKKSKCGDTSKACFAPPKEQ